MSHLEPYVMRLSAAKIKAMKPRRETSFTPAEIADILEEAADILVVDGWCQGTAHKMTSGGQETHCLLGAVSRAIQRHRAWGASPLVVDVIARHLGVSGKSRDWRATRVPEWNDRKDRTEGEVTDVLRHTAKDVRAGDLALEPQDRLPKRVLVLDDLDAEITLGMEA